jgi:hypothetical protein
MSSTLEPEVASSYSPAVGCSVVLDWAWHAYAVVAAATMVVVGLLWDISWHMSIGRDTFWTPAHLLIQSGGLVAGGSSGFLALHTTFRGTDAEKASAVSFWGFRAPLGAWVCVLGCGAMLTSAPFDDWWHNAYGLDVRIVSPPHILLGLGMMGLTVAKRVNPDILVLCHGGPISEPDDVRYVLKNTTGIVGFFGASSIERLPTEVAITGCVKQFKGIGL